MVTLSTNMQLQGPDDSDNAEVAVHSYITANNNKIDPHRHTGGTDGLIINTIPSGGLQVTVGNVGIGGAPATYLGINITGSILTVASGGIERGISSGATFDSSAVTEGNAVAGQVVTAASAFTMATATAFHALNPSKGAGSIISAAYGVLVDPITAGGSDNFGGWFGAASGATRNASLAAFGDVLFGAVDNGANATTATTGFVWIDSCAGAPTGVPAMNGVTHFLGHVAMQYDSANNKLWVYNGGWKGVVLA